MHPEGEQLHILERVVTSPVAGTFLPLDLASSHVEEDALIGHVFATGAVVEVRSRFRGHLIDVVACEGQRVQAYERIAWLRVA